MSYYNDPAFFIDFSQLPPPAVIETLAYEDILSSYKARVLAAMPTLARALNMEQSALNIILETEAFGELIVRARINAAARAVMLPFAVGTDLDNLAAFYNVIRAVNADGTKESDTRFRIRIHESPESFSSAGSPGAYRFFARTADPSIFDVSAMKINALGGVKVTIMNSIATPAPTSSQITNVLTYLNADNRKVLTDALTVTGPKIITTTIEANLTLYPGPDQGIVIAAVQAALKSLQARVAKLGYGLERSAIYSALMQEGVQGVELISPKTDLVPGLDGCVSITGASVKVLNNRTF
jgi:phage-related baseplate assembly protein